MSDPQDPRYVTENEFNKLLFYRERLIAILERDGTIDQFRGSTDYLLRSVIEALELQNIFYDAPGDKRQDVLINDVPMREPGMENQVEIGEHSGLTPEQQDEIMRHLILAWSKFLKYWI